MSVEIYINNSLIDLSDDEDIVETYSVNSFGDIASRNSSYSNTFKVPLTANNKSVLENSEVVLNNTNIPYESLDAKILVDSIDVLMGSGKAQVVKCKDGYELKVFGGNFDFYSLIKNKFLSELDLSIYDHEWNLANIAGSRVNANGYIYGIIDYHTDSPNSYFPSGSRTIDVRTLFPGTFNHTIISQIIADAGYTIQGDLLTDEDYLSLVIPFSNDKFERSNPEAEDFKAIKTSSQVISGAGSTPVAFTNDSTDGGFDTGGNYNTGTSRYIVPFNMVASFSATITGVTSGLGGTLRISVDQSSVGLVDIFTFSVVPGSNTFVINSKPISLIAGEYVQIEMDENITAGSFTVQSGSFFESHVTPAIQFNSDITMASTLPNIKQGDYFKAILQKFFAIIQVNNVTKVVTVKKFSEIVADKPNALDWSDKIDETEKTDLEFSMGNYAQINKCSYKDDSSVIKPDGTDYDLLIANTNLEAETELLKSPFAATEMVPRLETESVPQIKQLTAGARTSKVQPRILILDRREVTDAIVYHDPVNSASVTATNSIPFMYFIVEGARFNLGWENNLVPTNGTDIEDVLQNIKVVNELLRLNSSDINQLDFFIPIWLDKHSAYFYISEIKQYKVNKVESTVVELVKLP